MPVSAKPAPSDAIAALNAYHNEKPLSPVATDSSVLDCSLSDSSLLLSSVVPWLFPPFPFESPVPGVGVGVGSGVGVGPGVGSGVGPGVGSGVAASRFAIAVVISAASLSASA